MGFFNPLAFILSPLVLGVVLLYFVKSRPQKKVLSSTFLWRLVMNRVRPNSIWQRFRNSIFLVLQVLALLLGIISLARPYWTGGIYGDVILVLDRTASMGATDGAPSRFDGARRSLEEVLARVDPQTRILLASYGRRIVVEESFTTDRGRIRAALAGVKRRDETGAGIAELWSFLARWSSERCGEIHVFTDGLEVGEVPALLQDVAIRFHVFGSSGENLAITGLQVERRGEGAEVAADLFNRCGSSEAVDVELEQEGRSLARRKVRLEAGGGQTVRFEKLPLRPGLLRVRLRPETKGRDVLACDDEARVWVEDGAFRVIWVSARPDPVLRRLLSLDPAVRLRVMAPGRVDEILAQPCDLYLLDGTWDPAFLERSFLCFSPESGPRPWAGEGGVVDAPRIGVVDGTHGLTRYVSFSGVTIRRAVPLKLPDGARAVVDSDRGPLVAVRGDGALRQVVCAFHLGATDFPLRVSFPIFMANALKWLAGRDLGCATSYRAGDLLRLAPLEKKIVLESAGTTRELTAPGGGAQVVLDPFERVGMVTLRFDGKEKPCPVNLLDAEESDVRPADERRRRHEPLRPRATGAGASRLWRLFVALCLGLFVLEWFLFCRKGG